MAVDYRLLHRFEASWYMEAALREAASGVAARRRPMPDDERCEPATLLVLRTVPPLWLAEDDR
jgi:hypothetical protein